MWPCWCSSNTKVPGLRHCNQDRQIPVHKLNFLWTYRVCVGNLALSILQQICLDTMQYTGGPDRQCCTVPICIDTVSSGLDAQQFHRQVFRKWVKHPHRIASTSDTGHNGVGKFSSELLKLFLRLRSDDALKLRSACHRKAVPFER